MIPCKSCKSLFYALGGAANCFRCLQAMMAAQSLERDRAHKSKSDFDAAFDEVNKAGNIPVPRF